MYCIAFSYARLLATLRFEAGLEQQNLPCSKLCPEDIPKSNLDFGGTKVLEGRRGQNFTPRCDRGTSLSITSVSYKYETPPDNGPSGSSEQNDCERFYRGRTYKMSLSASTILGASTIKSACAQRLAESDHTCVDAIR